VLINPIATTPDVTVRSLFFGSASAGPVDSKAIAELNIVQLGEALTKLGHSVNVILADPFLDRPHYTLSDRLEVTSTHATLPRLFHPGIVPLTPGLRRHPAFRSSDVVQAGEFHQPSTYFACQAAQAAAIPLVLWQETFSPMRAPGRWYQWGYERVAGNRVRSVAKLFVPRTTKAAPYLLKLGIPERALTGWIPTGIDLSIYHPKSSPVDPSEFGWRRETRILLVVARLHRDKGVDFALRVLSRLRRRDPSLRLIVRGSGPQYSSLVRLAAALGVEDLVRFIGRVSRERMVDLYNAATLVLSTSQNDLMPFALLEASACARPCVVTDAGAITDIVVDGQTGVVQQGRSEGDFANAVLTLLRDEERRIRMETRARERMETLFSLPRVAAALTQVYHRARE